MLGRCCLEFINLLLLLSGGLSVLLSLFLYFFYRLHVLILDHLQRYSLKLLLCRLLLLFFLLRLELIRLLMVIKLLILLAIRIVQSLLLICIGGLGLLVYNALYGFDVFGDGFDLGWVLGLGLLACELLLRPCWLIVVGRLHIAGVLMRPEHFRFGVPFHQLRLLLLFRIQLLNQLTEQLCVFVMHRPFRILIREVDLRVGGVLVV